RRRVHPPYALRASEPPHSQGRDSCGAKRGAPVAQPQWPQLRQKSRVAALASPFPQRPERVIAAVQCPPGARISSENENHRENGGEARKHCGPETEVKQRARVRIAAWREPRR